MSNFIFKNRDGSTPLDFEQLEGIKYAHITTMGELDELEEINIQKGIDWLNHQTTSDYLSIHFLNKLHKKLFGDVWKWENLTNYDRVPAKEKWPENFKLEGLFSKQP